MRVGVLASLLKVVLVLVRKPPPCSTSVAKQVNPDSREKTKHKHKHTNTTGKLLERVGWGRGTKTRPKTYSTLSYERTPTDTHNPLSYTELATEGQGARGEGGDAMQKRSRGGWTDLR